MAKLVRLVAQRPPPARPLRARRRPARRLPAPRRRPGLLATAHSDP